MYNTMLYNQLSCQLDYFSITCSINKGQSYDGYGSEGLKMYSNMF